MAWLSTGPQRGVWGVDHVSKRAKMDVRALESQFAATIDTEWCLRRQPGGGLRLSSIRSHLHSTVPSKA